jgi:hypothetical protein
MTPEQQPRRHNDAALDQAGWAVQDRADLNLTACHGVAVREFHLGRLDAWVRERAGEGELAAARNPDP